MNDISQFRAAKAWKEALGLLPVPLRDSAENRERYVLLNGAIGNFCLDFIGNLDSSSQRAAAWSCDVGHYVTCVYEVMPTTLTLTGSAAGSGAQRTPSSGGMDLTLRPYSDANYPDSSADTEPGWPDVPGLPGGNIQPTIIPLDDGGEAAFYTGSGADGDSFQMPDSFTSSNKFCWASPQGYIEGNGHLHYIQDCDAYASRKLALIYNDGSGLSWRGDLNYELRSVANAAARLS